MPGEDIQSWSTTAATNANSDTSINWAEGQPRASVNNSARSMMAAHAKDRNLKNGSITTTGSANAQAFASGVTYTTVPTGLWVRLKLGFSNTGPTTLNMDSIGDVAIKDQAGNDVGGNQLVAGQYAEFLYDGTNWILLQSNIATFDALAYNGMQVNGTGEVDQYSRANTSPVSGAEQYFSDNWKIYKNGAVSVLASANLISALAAPLPGFTSAVRIYTTTPAAMATNDIVEIYTPIEGYRTVRLGWGAAGAQPVSIGFWVYVNASVPVPATLTLRVSNGDYTRLYRADVVINTTATWEFKTITIPGDVTGTWNKTNGQGMIVAFVTGAGTSQQGPVNSWGTAQGVGSAATSNFHTVGGSQVAITGLVVLPGVTLPSAAQSANIMRPFDQELQICQRYFEKSHNYATVPSTPDAAGMWSQFVTLGIGNYQAHGGIFLVRKRVVPSIIGWNYLTGAPGQATGTNTGPVSINFEGVSEASFDCYFGGTASDLFRFQWTADARM